MIDHDPERSNDGKEWIDGYAAGLDRRAGDGGPASQCSLRDYFAGQALQGSDSLTWPNPGEFASKEEIQALISKAAKVRAVTAYIVADAMLKARDAK